VRTLAITPRFPLHVGYACNERCSFCYYLPEIESGRARNFTTRQLFRRIDFAAWYGKRAVDITGGEPTIRPDLPDLIARCRARGIEAVTVITNGLRTASPEYARTLKEAGLGEGLFSLHGAGAETHDRLTKRPGSHGAVLRSIRVFSELGLAARINMVVTPENLQEVEGVLALGHELRVAAVNLLVFNPAESAAELSPDDPVRVVDYPALGEALSRALDLWKARLPLVNVRFLPFCFAPRHLDTIRTQWQKAHEAHEWDPVLNVLFQKGAWAAAGAILAGLLVGWDAPRYRAADVPTLLARSLSAFRMTLQYKKGPPCRSCAARRICTGLPRDYTRRHGFPAIAPLRAPEPYLDPLHFQGAP